MDWSLYVVVSLRWAMGNVVLHSIDEWSGKFFFILILLILLILIPLPLLIHCLALPLLID